MPDYKKMYTTLLDAVENVIEMLEKAENTCEEIYIDTTELK